VRNRIQHGALIVDSSAVDRFREATDQFFSQVLLKIFDRTIAQISLSELIRNIVLKVSIKQAEGHLDRGEYQKCIEFL